MPSSGRMASFAVGLGGLVVLEEVADIDALAAPHPAAQDRGPGREAAEHDFGTVGVGREGLDRPGPIAHRAGLVVGVEPSPEEDEGPAFGLLGPYEVDHLSSG